MVVPDPLYSFPTGVGEISFPPFFVPLFKTGHAFVFLAKMSERI
ncbi:hypothetical protein FTV88_0115 [Heliorestis convoluta]|uniref:Uncharacterized protein n=1 Tax=Heliorestis convoluta TaxID=356322 RepID=A0A5Q2MVP0_9FIRM|nr:hypothetical protein FTV88_0115 [Heliorestis convoluta]